LKGNQCRQSPKVLETDVKRQRTALQIQTAGETADTKRGKQRSVLIVMPAQVEIKTTAVSLPADDLQSR